MLKLVTSYLLLTVISMVFGITSLSASEKMILIDPIKIKAKLPKDQDVLKAFLIDKYEVTIGEFSDFIAKTKYKDYKGYRKPEKKNLKKATNRVHWFEAQKYCHWKKKRLPSEAEWLLAAGGLERKYPWGNADVDGTRANLCDVKCATPWSEFGIDDHYSRMAPVGTYPNGNTPEGVSDLAGNVWEWTSTLYGTGKTMKYKGKNHTREEMSMKMVLKGGSYGAKAEQLKNSYKVKVEASYRSSYTGFRCVKDLEE